VPDHASPPPRCQVPSRGEKSLAIHGAPLFIRGAT
jgi:hypothetical protein